MFAFVCVYVEIIAVYSFFDGLLNVFLFIPLIFNGQRSSHMTRCVTNIHWCINEKKKKCFSYTFCDIPVRKTTWWELQKLAVFERFSKSGHLYDQFVLPYVYFMQF